MDLKVQSVRKEEQAEYKTEARVLKALDLSGRSLMLPQDCLLSAGLHSGEGGRRGGYCGGSLLQSEHRWERAAQDPGFWSWPVLACPGLPGWP